jgi:hypothetical protein
LTPQQVLRSLILMRVKNWDYRELRERIADGLRLRRFTDFYCQPVPKHDAFHRAIIRLTPETLKAVNELLVRAAVAIGLEDGKNCVSTPRSCKLTFIIRPIIRCYGMWSVWSPASSAGSRKRFSGRSRVFAIARAQRGGGCRQSSG